MPAASLLSDSTMRDLDSDQPVVRQAHHDRPGWGDELVGAQ
jgi:hypothetical protein